MGGKRPTSEEIVAKLRQVEVLNSQGKAVADAVRAIGVTEVTYYRWRKENRLPGDHIGRQVRGRARHILARFSVAAVATRKSDDPVGAHHVAEGRDAPYGSTSIITDRAK